MINTILHMIYIIIMIYIVITPLNKNTFSFNNYYKAFIVNEY